MGAPPVPRAAAGGHAGRVRTDAVLKAFLARAVAAGEPSAGFHHADYVLPLTEPLARVLGREPGTLVTVRVRRDDVVPVVIRTWPSEPEILRAVRAVLPRVPECLVEGEGFAVHSHVEGTSLAELCGPGKPVSGPLLKELAELLAAVVQVRGTALPPLPPGRPSNHTDSQGFLRTLAHLADRQIRRPNWSRYGGLFVALGVPEDALLRFADRVPAMTRRPYGLLHGDLHRGNVVVPAAGEPLHCVDWELAGYGDPLHDLAVHLVRMRYPAHQWDEAVDAWAGAVRPVAVAGLARDLRHYVAFEHAQSLYAELIRAARRLEETFDRPSLDRAVTAVHTAFQHAAKPLCLGRVPEKPEIERVLFRRGVSASARAEGRGRRVPGGPAGAGKPPTPSAARTATGAPVSTPAGAPGGLLAAAPVGVSGGPVDSSAVGVSAGCGGSTVVGVPSGVVGRSGVGVSAGCGGSPVVGVPSGVVGPSGVGVSEGPAGSPVVGASVRPADSSGVGVSAGAAGSTVVGVSARAGALSVGRVLAEPADSPVVGVPSGVVGSSGVGVSAGAAGSPVVGVSARAGALSVGRVLAEPADSPVVGVLAEPADSPVVGVLAEPGGSPVVGVPSGVVGSSGVGVSAGAAGSPVVGASVRPADSSVVGVAAGLAGPSVVGVSAGDAGPFVVGVAARSTGPAVAGVFERGGVGWVVDRRVPEHAEFPRSAVVDALLLEGAAPAERVFKGAAHLTTVLHVPGTRFPVVVRREATVVLRREPSFLSEHAVLRAIERSGVPVAAPRVLALGTSHATDPAYRYQGDRFTVHTYEGARDLGRRPQHPVHGLLPHEADCLVDQLAALTAVDYAPIDPVADRPRFHDWLCEQLVALVAGLPKESQQLARFLGLPDAPRLREILARHRVTDRAPALLHGDLNPWNLVRRDDGPPLTLIDWELALVGDPLYDLVRHMHLTPTRPEIRDRMFRRWETRLAERFTRNWQQDWPVYRWIETVRSAYVDLDRLVTGASLDAPNVRRAVESYAMTLAAATASLGLSSRRRRAPQLTRALAWPPGPAGSAAPF